MVSPYIRFVHPCVPDEGVHYLPKPFSILEMASKVREVLSGANPTG